LIAIRRLIGPITTLAVMSSFATFSHGQPQHPEHPRESSLPPTQLRPLLAYLRCEEVPLDEFGQAQIPMRELSLLLDRYVAGRPSDDLPLIPLKVWAGTQAQLQVLAGQGFFAVLQFYPTTDKRRLLEALTAEGWTMKRVPPDGRHLREPSLALVPVHEDSKPMGRLVRTLRLEEAHVDVIPGHLALDGLTLTCTYRTGEKR
jgi:hypothetical protein